MNNLDYRTELGGPENGPITHCGDPAAGKPSPYIKVAILEKDSEGDRFSGYVISLNLVICRGTRGKFKEVSHLATQEGKVKKWDLNAFCHIHQPIELVDSPTTPISETQFTWGRLVNGSSYSSLCLVLKGSLETDFLGNLNIFKTR